MVTYTLQVICQWSPDLAVTNKGNFHFVISLYTKWESKHLSVAAHQTVKAPHNNNHLLSHILR